MEAFFETANFFLIQADVVDEKYRAVVGSSSLEWI